MSDEFDPRHPHEPEIPPAFDAEGRCLVCRLIVERDDARAAAERANRRADDAVHDAIDSAFVAGLQKHDGGLWELAFAAGRGAERERIVAALDVLADQIEREAP